MSDKLNAWEKAALFTVGSASAFNVLLWALGYGLIDAAPALSPLGVLRVLFAIVSFIGLDLTIVVTVMAQRDGRRSVWAWLTACAAMAAAGGMALEVARVVAWPALHAAPVMVLFFFMHHLAAPRVAQRAEVVAQEASELRRTVAQLGAQLAQAEREVARVPDLLAQRDTEVAQAAEDLAQAQADAAHWRAMAAQRALTDDAERVTIGGSVVSLRRMAAQLKIPETTLRRKVTQATKEEV
jgi:hypothetical protein